MENRTVKKRIRLLCPAHKLSLRKQAEMVEVSRSSFYFKSKGQKPENLELMRIMDKLFLDDPTLGILGM
ncbi:MAG: hypothetical protein GVX78_04150 [Bacteroidetes bacterium]|nr:hypothetical protein [Bacteroidota bacterium]